MKIKTVVAFCLVALFLGCAPQADVSAQQEPPAPPASAYEYDEPDHWELKVDQVTVERRTAAVQEKQLAAMVKLAVESGDFERAVADLKICYEAGLVAAADRIIDSHPRVFRWNQLEGITVTSDFLPMKWCRTGDMRLTLTPDEPLAETIAVVFPPGLSARPTDHRFKLQNLGLLRAPIIQVKDEVEMLVPIACLSFGLPAPNSKLSYQLESLESGSGVYRLLVAICSKNDYRSAAPQLALWIVGDKLTYKGYKSGRPGLSTFDGVCISEHDSGRSAEVMIDAGVDPRSLKYYGGDKLVPELLPTPDLEAPENVEG